LAKDYNEKRNNKGRPKIYRRQPEVFMKIKRRWSRWGNVPKNIAKNRW
jgi:hypothetical protein